MFSGTKSILLVCLLLLAACSSENKNIPQDNKTGSPATSSGSGQYSIYKFDYQIQGDQVAVTFSPMLPRDDATVIGAMLEVINTIYGKHKVTNLSPSLVERRGTNVIRFEGTDVDYFFLLIKEDTGEVHSFSIWTESK